MDLILGAIVGYWCHTPPIYPRPWPQPEGGGNPDPDTPPAWCTVCGSVAGALAALLTVYFLGPYYARSGMLGTVALAFFGGSVGANLADNIGDRIRGRQT